MRVLTFTVDGKEFMFNVDDFANKLLAYRNRCEQIGATPASVHRADTEKAALRRQHLAFANELEQQLDATLETLMGEAFAAGFKHAKVSDGKQFHCKACLAGYDNIQEVFAHVETSANPECQKALEKALHDTVK